MSDYQASNFLVPNATFIAELIAFFIILWILWTKVIPPINKALEARQAVIRRALEEAREADEKLKKAEEAYRNALNEARAEAAKMREEARSEGKRIVEEMRRQAAEQAAAITAANQRQMEVDRQRAMDELRTEVGRLAVDLASRIVGESLEDEARKRRTVDRFIEEIDQSDRALT
ncbi:MAG: F-type H+-transporting ATPase subunit b [Frankiales bacterium]|jgi:F-type H+-transporting ATPase subunit b|nr:F-type H+-transporting ATPase subunit b [Frankiales bacterium]